ncbi:MAG TPA: BrnT family toxin [Pyrinomonadaceae bacterium]|nr:BrnT family toxin [Pyrinomonadaceae bacterium]
MEFEWDKEKAKANFKKHGVNFEEAALAFYDENAVELFDELNSDAEIRFQIVGISNIRLLFVSYTERDEKIRIISARTANAKHIKIYNEQND